MSSQYWRPVESATATELNGLVFELVLTVDKPGILVPDFIMKYVEDVIGWMLVKVTFICVPSGITPKSTTLFG